MTFSISSTKTLSGREAALKGSWFIRQTLAEKGCASLILATGSSQFEILHHLAAQDIDWSQITVFHLDEYVGISAQHNASFRKYLQERFANQVKGLKAFHYIQGDAPSLENEIVRLNALIAKSQIDVAFVGIGENGHLAFNDPPADFDTEAPYLVVSLDKACRLQQFHEGWFDSLEAVPTQAISMSVRQILKSTHIINTVPDARKAEAIANCFNHTVSKFHPASILKEHPSCFHFFERESAARLDLTRCFI
ncbi:MAG: glucosamine-6-phosphate deaminase [Spirochaetota bacterium]